VVRRLRISNTSGHWLERAIKDKSRAACDLPGNDILTEQRIQARPKLLQKEMLGNPGKGICIEHSKELGGRLFARENNCAVS